MRLNELLIVLLALMLAPGCAVSRITTTEQTAVEEALLSASVDRSLDELDLGGHAGRSFFVADGLTHLPEGEYVLAELRRRLLGAGMIEAATRQRAQILITPVVGHLAIDDAHTMIGLPSIPLIVPAVGTIDLPELAIFRTDTQFGRSRIGVFGRDADTGTLLFDAGPVASQSRYKRWRVLVFFSFRTTDLPHPF